MAHRGTAGSRAWRAGAEKAPPVWGGAAGWSRRGRGAPGPGGRRRGPGGRRRGMERGRGRRRGEAAGTPAGAPAGRGRVVAACVCGVCALCACVWRAGSRRVNC